MCGGKADNFVVGVKASKNLTYKITYRKSTNTTHNIPLWKNGPRSMS